MGLFFFIIFLMVIFEIGLYLKEKDIIREIEFQERRQKEKEERFKQGFYW